MSATPLFGLDHLTAGQTGNDTRYNETLDTLDALVSRRLVNRGLQSPSGETLSDGDVYLVDGAGTGEWAGQSNKLAVRAGGGWKFADLPANTAWYVITDGASTVEALQLWDGSSWTTLVSKP